VHFYYIKISLPLFAVVISFFHYMDLRGLMAIEFIH